MVVVAAPQSSDLMEQGQTTVRRSLQVCVKCTSLLSVLIPMSLKAVTLVFLLKNNGTVLLAMKKRGFGIGKWNGNLITITSSYFHLNIPQDLVVKRRTMKLLR